MPLNIMPATEEREPLVQSVVHLCFMLVAVVVADLASHLRVVVVLEVPEESG